MVNNMKKYLLFLLYFVFTTTALFAQTGEKYVRHVSPAHNTYPNTVEGIQQAIASLTEGKGEVVLHYSVPGIDTAGLGVIPPDIHLRGWHYYFSLYYIPFSAPTTFDAVRSSLLPSPSSTWSLADRFKLDQQATGIYDHLGRTVFHAVDRFGGIDVYLGGYGLGSHYVRIEQDLNQISLATGLFKILATDTKVEGNFEVTENTIKLGTTDQSSGLMSISGNTTTFKTTDGIGWLIKQGNLSGDNMYIVFGDVANQFSNVIATHFSINSPEGWLQFSADSTTFNGFVSLRNDIEVDGDLKVIGTINQVKEYIVLLTQSSTTAPVATVIVNTLGLVPVWSYNDVGEYLLTGTGDIFTTDKTIILIGANPIGVQRDYETDYVSQNILYLGTKDSSTGFGIDASLTITTFIVRIYP